jgi:hypothetical protein
LIAHATRPKNEWHKLFDPLFPLRSSHLCAFAVKFSGLPLIQRQTGKLDEHNIEPRHIAADRFLGVQQK